MSDGGNSCEPQDVIRFSIQEEAREVWSLSLTQHTLVSDSVLHLALPITHKLLKIHL